jgi:hypothetical protein
MSVKKRTFITMSPAQFLSSSLLVGVIAGGITVLNSMYQEHRLLPVVVQAETGECMKVVNFDNGHAFNCADKDVVLRRYRVTAFTEPANEKLPAPDVQQLPSNDRSRNQ